MRPSSPDTTRIFEPFEKNSGAAFVGFRMSEFVAQDAVIRLTHRRQRQRVGGSAVEREEDFAVDLEQVTQQVRGFRSPLVIAVSGSVALIRAGHCLPGFGADSRIIVTGKVTMAGARVDHGTLPRNRIKVMSAGHREVPRNAESEQPALNCE